VTADKLFSQQPSERLLAAQELLRDDSSRDVSVILSALNAENVPRIRTVLRSALARARAEGVLRVTDGVTCPGEEQRATTRLQTLSGMIEHELAAAIGWIDYSASRELVEYETSETKAALLGLQRRVEGLVAITAANRTPRRSRVALSEVVLSSIPPEYPESASRVVDEPGGDDIVTDVALLLLILFNALRNAYESAARTGDEQALVTISLGVNTENFWVAISNPYVGAPFVVEDVRATGVTSKTDHRGMGVQVMLTAAAALQYEIELTGTGQVASFRLRGSRAISA
jgi:hypothetical protein